jgi:F420H(2)-dependent quinone reductase
MSFEKTPGGTRGTRTPPGGPLMRGMMRAMTGVHKMSGDKFQGMDLLYLTTVGAKTGQKRQSTVARFQDGEDAWLVVEPRDQTGPGASKGQRPSLISRPAVSNLAGMRRL